MVSRDWVKTTARWDKKHLGLGVWWLAISIRGLTLSLFSISYSIHSPYPCSSGLPTWLWGNLTIGAFVWLLQFLRSNQEGPLQWRHNEREGVSIHRRLDCCSAVRSGANQRRHQRSRSLAFVRNSPVNSPQKGQLRVKCFHLMTSSWHW